MTVTIILLLGVKAVDVEIIVGANQGRKIIRYNPDPDGDCISKKAFKWALTHIGGLPPGTCRKFKFICFFFFKMWVC